MKKITLLLGVFLMSCASLLAQAPSNAPDVMLQGFYWDSFANGSYGNTTWATLQSQVEELSESFDLVWLPPSGKASSRPSTGYDPKKWSDQNSSWGSVTELKALIAAFKANGTRCVADIVINHRNGNYHWGDFENETFGSQTYTLYPSGQFICSDDEVRNQPNEVVPTGAKDAGYETVCDASGGYCASRDLDHSNAYLQKTIKAYLCWLKDEIGYDGWRYDLVKGYLGKYTAMYNDAANAYMSVGEYWDYNYGGVEYWIKETNYKSMAFDFPMKYSALNDALSKGNYQGMASSTYNVPQGLCGADNMKRYSVTFVDNHDTFRDHNKYNGPSWEQANAYILSAPGIPCVFWPHWVSCKKDIKAMIKARKSVGVHSQSKCTTEGTCGSYYKCTTTGTKGTLICFIGSGWSDPAGYTKACSGNGWAYYTSTGVNIDPTPGPTPTPTPDPTPGGTGYSLYVNGKDLYNMTDEGAWDMDQTFNQFSLTGVALKSGDTFVFYNNSNGETWGNVTVDPASVAGINGTGTNFSVSADGCYSVYLKLKWQSDNVYFGTGSDCGSVTPTPTPDPDPVPTPDPTPGGSITLKVKASSIPWGNKCYLYTWDGGELGAEVKYTGEWPGTAMTLGSDGFYTYTVNQSMVYAIFTDGSASGTLQTDDIQNITASTCYEISSELHDNMLGAASYDAIETACPEPVSIIETEAVGLNIYPNPTSDFITISCDEVIDEVVISALNGSEVIRTKSNEIDLSILTPSIYFVNVMLQNGDVVRSKVIRK